VQILYLLIPVAVVLVLVASVAYVWAVTSGQYDDLDREADTILFDEAGEESANRDEI